MSYDLVTTVLVNNCSREQLFANGSCYLDTAPPPPPPCIFSGKKIIILRNARTFNRLLCFRQGARRNRIESSKLEFKFDSIPMNIPKSSRSLVDQDNVLRSPTRQIKLLDKIPFPSNCEQEVYLIKRFGLCPIWHSLSL